MCMIEVFSLISDTILWYDTNTIIVEAVYIIKLFIYI